MMYRLTTPRQPLGSRWLGMRDFGKTSGHDRGRSGTVLPIEDKLVHEQDAHGYYTASSSAVKLKSRILSGGTIAGWGFDPRNMKFSGGWKMRWG